MKIGQTVVKALQTYNHKKWELNDDSILIVDAGKYYITFGEDAIKVGKIMGIIPVNLDDDFIALPFRDINYFFPKIIRAGNKIELTNIIEQHGKRFADSISQLSSDGFILGSIPRCQQ